MSFACRWARKALLALVCSHFIKVYALSNIARRTQLLRAGRSDRDRDSKTEYEGLQSACVSNGLHNASLFYIRIPLHSSALQSSNGIVCGQTIPAVVS